MLVLHGIIVYILMFSLAACDPSFFRVMLTHQTNHQSILEVLFLSSSVG